MKLLSKTYVVPKETVCENWEFLNGSMYKEIKRSDNKVYYDSFPYHTGTWKFSFIIVFCIKGVYLFTVPEQLA